MKNFVKLFLIVFCFFASSGIIHAAEFRTGDMLTFPEETVIDGNLFVAGNDIVVRSEVTGDIVCAGKNITISGSVGGDVLCVGQAIGISGEVGGSVRTASQNLSLYGIVNRNVTSLGQNIGISQAVVGDVFVFGASQIISNADIGGSIYGTTEILEVNGKIGKDVKATATSLSVGGSASISGELQYESEKEAQIAKGATIGKITHKTPSTEVKEKKTETKNDFVVLAGKKIAEKIWLFVVYLIFGILFVVLFPRFAIRIGKEMETQTGSSFIFGFLAMFSIPLALLFFTITIIGIPIVFLGGLLFALTLLISRLSIAFVIGKKVLEAIKNKNSDNLLVQIFVGSIVVSIVFSIPIFGGMLEFFACVLGLGAIARILDTRKK